MILKKLIRALRNKTPKKGRLFPRPPLIATRFLGMFFVATFVVSCSGTTVVRDVGQLNLGYKLPEQQPKTQYVIAIVAPEFTGKEQQTQQTQQPIVLDPITAMIMARMGHQPKFNFFTVFSSTYKPDLVNAMKDSLEELISRKGFVTKGPYATFDDITYMDKKAIYLASVPKLTLDIVRKGTNTDCSPRIYCTEKGQIQITGGLTYKLVEPLTGQTFLNRRINLSDFNISKPYIRQYQTKGAGDTLGKIMDKASAPDKLVDDTDKVLVEAINEFFAKAMAKLNQFISREEIISFTPDVNKLKDEAIIIGGGQ
ncbi:MAG: hypothetical protein ABFS56_25900 [Pseudomonadota bacterium]